MEYSFLQKTPLFEGLSISETETALRCLMAHSRKFLPLEVICRAGSQTDEICVVISGSVNIVVNDYWGGSSIFGHIEKGQIFAEAYAVASGQELLCNAVAAEKTEILFINSKRLLDTGNEDKIIYRKLLRNLLRISANKNIQLSKRMMHIAPRTIRSRLLSYFSEQAIVFGSNEFTIPFSRQQLADYLGVERSALSGELSKMKQSGLIDYKKNTFELIAVSSDEMF